MLLSMWEWFEVTAAASLVNVVWHRVQLMILLWLSFLLAAPLT